MKQHADSRHADSDSCELLSKFVSLTYETAQLLTDDKATGCELLSKFVSLTYETATVEKGLKEKLL